MKSRITGFLFLVAISSFAQEKMAKDTTKLKEQKNELQEVSIAVQQKKYFKIEANKTTVSVTNNALLNSGSSYDAIKRLPGIISSPTGSLYYSW